MSGKLETLYIFDLSSHHTFIDIARENEPGICRESTHDLIWSRQIIWKPMISVASGTCHDIRIIRRQQGNSKECQSQVRAGGLRCEAKSIIFAAPQIDCGLDQQHAQRVVHPSRCKALQILLLTYISFRRKETHAQHNSFCNSRCLNGLTASVNTEMTIAIAIITSKIHNRHQMRHKQCDIQQSNRWRICGCVSWVAFA